MMVAFLLKNNGDQLLLVTNESRELMSRKSAARIFIIVPLPSKQLFDATFGSAQIIQVFEPGQTSGAQL
jgi:hypothetical protein